ncbi:MAG: hypothetical protein QME68_06490, partial [Elusimicrobiota bacterium]|nr:hypothetical protein [Elusimicrobiota bacterium]
GLSPQTQFAIKDIIGQTTYYVQLDGSLVSVSSWAVYSVWAETITVIGLSPNRKHDFYLGVKNAKGEIVYDFDIYISTYTLSEQPELALFEVSSD